MPATCPIALTSAAGPAPGGILYLFRKRHTSPFVSRPLGEPPSFVGGTTADTIRYTERGCGAVDRICTCTGADALGGWPRGAQVHCVCCFATTARSKKPGRSQAICPACWSAHLSSRRS